jgi:hypothetical protein
MALDEKMKSEWNLLFVEFDFDLRPEQLNK